jgi:hypothetical protein
MVIVSTYTRIPIIGESWLLVLNITFAIYLLFEYWKKWKREIKIKEHSNRFS